MFATLAAFLAATADQLATTQFAQVVEIYAGFGGALTYMRGGSSPVNFGAVLVAGVYWEPVYDRFPVNVAPLPVFTRRGGAAGPAKAERKAPEPVAPDASNPAGLQAMFAQEKTFAAKSASFIAKFIAFVVAREVDPMNRDLVASLLPRFLDEIEKATPPTARALIQALEAGDAKQLGRMLEAGLDPGRIVLRPDRPPNNQHLQDFAKLAARYEAAPPESRAAEFVDYGLKAVLPSLNESNRPKYPGRNALTLALACKAGLEVVATICLWVERQRRAGKDCDLLDRPDGQGCTPLTVAVEVGDWACVNLLLDRGANIDRPCPRPNYAYTPLMAAVCKKNGAR